MKIQLLLAPLLACCFTSCASTGHSITQPKVDQITPGYTTEADLVQLFGPPTTRSTDIYRTTSLDWFRSEGPSWPGYLPLIGSFLGGLDVEVQQLSVVLRADGRVRSFTLYDLNGNVKRGKARPPVAGETRYSK
jgi:outer membrane protein assembly factor BamE (lipoprotein component of BamABCDE complex)